MKEILLERGYTNNLNYLQTLKDIDGIVNNDFCFSLQEDREITQDEVKEMIKIISEVYKISHSIECKTCAGKYLI